MRWAVYIALIVGSALFAPIVTYGQSNQTGPLTGVITEVVLGPDETRDPQGYQKGEGYLPYSQSQEKQTLQGQRVTRDQLTATVSCSHNDGDTIGPGLVPSGSNAHWIKVAAQVHRTENGSTLEIFYLEDRFGNIWSSREYKVGGVTYQRNDAGNHMKPIDLTPQHPPGRCLPPTPRPTANGGQPHGLIGTDTNELDRKAATCLCYFSYGRPVYCKSHVLCVPGVPQYPGGGGTWTGAGSRSERTPYLGESPD